MSDAIGNFSHEERLSTRRRVSRKLRSPKRFSGLLL